MFTKTAQISYDALKRRWYARITATLQLTCDLEVITTQIRAYTACNPDAVTSWRKPQSQFTMLNCRSNGASGQHFTKVSMQLRLCASRCGNCTMTAQTSYLLYNHAMQVLPLVAKEDLVLVMRHFQCINADNLHEDRVNNMIKPVNNELDPTLACEGIDCTQVSTTAV